jgi:hypothetical protein
MNKHTPGPWTLAVAEDCPPIVIKPGVHDICVMQGAMSNAGVMADARLIAVAPEMLAELQRLADAFGWGGEHPAVQLIAKATGAMLPSANAVAKAKGTK